MTTRTLLLALMVGFAGCTEAHPFEPDASLPPDAPPPDAAVVIDAGSDAPIDAARASDAPVPAFDDIYTSILVPRCGPCHVDESPERYHYTPRMTDVEVAYAALIDVPVQTPWAEHCVPEGVTAHRVRPGDLTASMLSFLPDCYVRDAQHDTLTEEELATIRGWIASGAPRSRF